MKRFILGLLLFSPLPRAEAADRPNIVVILIDDVGFSDIGCFGSEIPTPNLDKLAAGGLRFNQFYNTARCSTTRAALLSGLYPHQAGMGWLDNKVEPNSKGFHGRLLPRCVTIAEVLRDSHYFTAMAGKWHLGQQNGCTPVGRGFTRSLNSRFGEVYFPREADKPGTKMLYLDGREIPKNSPELGTDWYSTDLFTDWSLKFIDEAKARQQPFFLYLAQGAAHFPLRAPEDVIAKYRGKYMAGWDKLREQRHAKQVELGIVDPKWPLAPRPPQCPDWHTLTDAEKERFDQMMAVYAAMIDRIDYSVGTLVQGLKQRGIFENTLIMFMSDNGGNAEGGPNGVTKGEGSIGSPQSDVLLGMNWATLCNTPFARYKHFTHEGGVSSPFIVHWPAGVPADRNGSIISTPSHLVDIMPTCVQAAGASYPGTFGDHQIEPMEGLSLLPVLQGKLSSRPTPIFWEHEGNKAVRDGKWKLVMRHKEPWQLFDMDADRTEQRDLSQANPETVQRLQLAWSRWAERTQVDDWNGPDHTDWGADIVKSSK